MTYNNKKCIIPPCGGWRECEDYIMYEEPKHGYGCSCVYLEKDNECSVHVYEFSDNDLEVEV